MTLCNMVIEAGGKNGVIAPDQVTRDFVDARNAGKKPYTVYQSDPGAQFEFEKVYDISKLEPIVAKPHSPDNKAKVSELRGTKLDRAYIGSCTGGKMTDFRAAAAILKGHTVRIDTFVVPATSEIANQAEAGTTEWANLGRSVFVRRGEDGRALVCRLSGRTERHFWPAEYGAELHQYDQSQFSWPYGAQASEVFLASPMTVAASALNGTITDPRDCLQ